MALAIALGTTAWRRQPPDPEEFQVAGVPSMITIHQGDSHNLLQYLSGGASPYDVEIREESPALPDGVSLVDGVLHAAGDAELNTGSEPEMLFRGVDSESPGALNVQFGLTSAVGGTDLPFAFGHVFREGDVPAGSYVDADLTDWQAIPITYWPDGSLRHAHIAGLATCTQGVPKTITLSTSSTPRSGTALTQSDLTAALASKSFSVFADSEEISLASLVGTSALKRTVCAGPVMSNWIYQKAITGSATERLWLDVRLFKNGNIDVWPWIENCTTMVSGLTNHVRNWRVEVNGAEVYDEEIDVKARTRPSLLFHNFGWWLGDDPEITPAHHGDYLSLARLVPQYGWKSPGETVLNNLPQYYEPNTTVGMVSLQTSGGDSAAILGHTRSAADPLYLTTGDPRAWRAMLTHALSGGSWHSHFRDETTLEPVKFSDWPTLSFNTGGSPALPSASGGVNAPLGATSSWTSHQPSFGYLAWLCTGRWYFLEEMLFWCGVNYLQETPTNRSNSDFLIKSNDGSNTDRGAAWGLRTLAQALASVPADHPLFAGLKHAWQANVDWYHGMVVSGALAAGSYQNNLGILPIYLGGLPLFSSSYDYSGNNCDCAGWMQMMIVGVLGFAHGLKLPQSTQTKLSELCSHAFKLPVGLAGGGDAEDEWDYRWFGPYELAYGLKGERFFVSWREAYEATVSQRALSPSGSNLQRPGTQTVWDDSTYLGSYFGQHHTALALAVDFGAEGAQEAWDRVTAAPNYAGYTSGFNNAPFYGIVPRPQ